MAKIKITINIVPSMSDCLTPVLHRDPVQICLYALQTLITGQYRSQQWGMNWKWGITPFEGIPQNIFGVSKTRQTAAPEDVMLLVACGSDVLSGVQTLS
jgi:hypothetical protein